VPRSPARPEPLHGKVFRGSTVLGAQRLTRGQLRSSAWRRLFPDVYACASLPGDHRLRARAVARLLLPDAVLSGRSAAVLWGVDLAGPDDDVECTVPVTCRAGTARGVRVTRRALPPEDVVTRGGVRVTTQLRTALDLARVRPLEEAVVALDQFLRIRRMSVADLKVAAAGLTGPGSRQIRKAVDKADGLAQSPQETRLRLRLHASRLPQPVAQYEVRDARGFVARVDFAWPEARVAVEYDGWWHGQPQNVPKDRRRLNRLTAAGWRVIFATADDIHDPVQLVARIGAALAAASARR
jgi:very-short-patch-repair endonuclease